MTIDLRRSRPKRPVDPAIRRVTARFGPLRIGLEMPGAELSAWQWVDPPGLSADLELSLHLEPTPPQSPPPESRPGEPGPLRYRGRFATGWLDIEEGRGHFALHPDLPETALAEYHAFDGAKEAAFTATHEMLMRRGGVMLHAATLRIGELAYVVTGDSGAGKSTLADRFEEGWFGDEWALLCPDDQGAWRCWRWAQWHWRWPDEPWSLPLGGILGLSAERDVVRVVPMTVGEGLSMIAASTYWLPWWPHQDKLDRLVELTKRHPPSWLSHDLGAELATVKAAMASAGRSRPR